jgi:hypothetical protein
MASLTLIILISENAATFKGKKNLLKKNKQTF